MLSKTQDSYFHGLVNYFLLQIIVPILTMYADKNVRKSILFVIYITVLIFLTKLFYEIIFNIRSFYGIVAVQILVQLLLSCVFEKIVVKDIIEMKDPLFKLYLTFSFSAYFKASSLGSLIVSIHEDGSLFFLLYAV